MFFLLTIAFLLFHSFKDSRRTQAIEKFLTGLASQKLVLWIPILWLTIAYGLLFLSDHQLGSLASYRGRLLPIFLWLAVLAVQFLLSAIYIQGINPEVSRDHRSMLRASLVIFILFGLLTLGIRLTRIGLTPDEVYWQGPGTPILLQQVFLAILAGAFFDLLIERTNFGRSARFDAIVSVVLWGLTCIIWLNQSADLTWFSMKPTAPNYQSYPFSDALVYDHAAREYLIGKPISSDFWVKPLYAFFLTGLHVFAGENYTLLTSLQVIFLAVIPVFAYLLIVRLGSRTAGLIMALLLMLREHNALMLSNVIQVSHVKLLLSDVFAMGLMVLLLWAFFHWGEKPGERRVMPLVLGGILSLLVLTRGHPIFLLPFLLCAVYLGPVPHFRLRWEAVVLTFLGFLIALLPWLWRNYELTGKLAFQFTDSPYSAQISNLYSSTPRPLDPEDLPPRYSGESDSAYYDRLQKQAIRFTLDHPDQVAEFISAHYFHNLIFSYIYLPHSFRIEGIKDYVKTEPFWNFWQGNLSTEGQVLFFINLSMVALGFGYLWKQHKHLTLVPLFFGVGYNLSVSIGRLSGWRLILPADWITLIYYAAGLTQFYHLLQAFVNREVSPTPQEHRTSDIIHPLKRLPLIGFTLFFLTLSMALTKGHILFSQRYPDKSVSQLKEDYNKAANIIPSLIPSSLLDDFLKTDGAVIVYGQAQNPSFLVSDQEELKGVWSVFYFWPHYRPQPFSRVIFNLSGPKSAGVVLPMESPPSSFPDGADVIVIGCWAESGEINALAVLIQGEMPTHYLSEPFPAPTCSVPAP
ncbi:MAG TPA: hypothetical protein VFQ13_17495 [Anaerolineales bacterium]|nr:hypothetical protein [Anaerolineales bacterium]